MLLWLGLGLVSVCCDVYVVCTSCVVVVVMGDVRVRVGV